MKTCPDCGVQFVEKGAWQKVCTACWAKSQPKKEFAPRPIPKEQTTLNGCEELNRKIDYLNTSHQQLIEEVHALNERIAVLQELMSNLGLPPIKRASEL